MRFILFSGVLAVFLVLVYGCKKEGFRKEWTQEKAPAEFRARFETTEGDFEIVVRREWSPKGADRLYQLIKHDYFTNAIFYRVVKKYVAQFGNTDAMQMAYWRQVSIPDEPVLLKNTRGTISFASSGKETRDLELFINLDDNPTLDTVEVDGVRGFPAVGRVTNGMDVADRLYSGYGEKPMGDGNLYADRSTFMRRFSRLDQIRKAYLLDN